MNSSLLNTITNEDCLSGMGKIEPGSIDMIFCDLPYGVTQCEWDKVIPFDLLWGQYLRIIKNDGAIILTAQQPFASELILSCKKYFRYEVIWEKDRAGGHLNAKRCPLRAHENVLIFYKKLPLYNPQMTTGERRSNKSSKTIKPSKSPNYGAFANYERGGSMERYPRSVIKINTVNTASGILHSTQKPVPLVEWFIKTYTNEGDIVLDNCMGSGTTAIACINTNRQFIGFEKQSEYYHVAIERIKAHHKPGPELFT